MGYTTEFFGSVEVVPPLNAAEIEYLRKFSESRRMNRTRGRYYAEPGNNFGQDHTPDVLDYNRPPPGQPGLWCHWVPTEDGREIEWDGGEKFYDAAAWMQYIINHFLKPGCFAKCALPFLQANHVVNGNIEAHGEDHDDQWLLRVINNKVTTHAGRTVYV